MRNARQILPGLLIGLLSILITLGGLALSFSEARETPASITDTAPPKATNTRTVVIPSLTPLPPSTATATRTQTPSLTTTHTTPTPSLSLSPSPSPCPPPPGWIAYLVKSGDTLESLARKHKVGADSLRQLNCLLTDTLIPGRTLFVPPLPTATKEPCGAPAGWVVYIVQPGDTLYRISRIYGITVLELQKANCMGSSTVIVVGKRLYVPPWAPADPTPTDETLPIPTWTDIVLPTETPTPTYFYYP
jgi:LysM repeat protein